MSVKKRRYFVKMVTLRASNDMLKLIDAWLSNPLLIDKDGKALFTSRSHFVKCAIIKQFDDLQIKYGKS